MHIIVFGKLLFFLQVILDVVYNHTNEADDEHPYTTSFRGIDNKVNVLVFWLQKSCSSLMLYICLTDVLIVFY